MKKIICLIFAIIFYIIGLIGILLPIFPQIPFFVIGTAFLCIGFEGIRNKIKKTKIYNKYFQKYVEKNKFLLYIFEEN